MNLDTKLIYICFDFKANFVKDLINNFKFNEPVTLLYHSKLYTSIFINIKEFIIQVDEIIKSCLEFKDFETDFYILLFIILEIKNIIFNEKMPLNYIQKLKKYKHNDFNINNNDDFQIKENNAIINKKINNDTIIKDCNKYYMDGIVDLLKKKNKLFKLNYKFNEIRSE